jgi:hypothetical protein
MMVMRVVVVLLVCSDKNIVKSVACWNILLATSVTRHG